LPTISKGIFGYLVRDRLFLFVPDVGGQMLSFFLDGNGFKICPLYGIDV
jgi:hypothetical protein